MKKIIKIIPFLFCIFILTVSCVPFVYADGGMIMLKEDRWEMLDEDQQLCAINYNQGIQNMILSVNTGEEITGEKAVWIFPVPAKPEKTVINIVEGFPEFNGYDVKDKAENSVSDMFDLIRLSQVYTMPLLILTGTMGKASGSYYSEGIEQPMGIGGGIKGVTVHESIERSGLTTELVSAINSDSFSNYIISKELDIPSEFKSILNEYIGEEYSFVVSWISDVEKFKLEHPEGYLISLIEDGKIDEARELFDGLDYSPEKYERYGFHYNVNEIFEDVDEGREIKDYHIKILKQRRGTGNILSVFISFPTEKMYYPLKPTSVYGSKKVPAIIYVMDYVQPELYPEIKAYTETDYYFRENFDVPEELVDFFGGSDIKDLKYTKIKIDPPSKYLTEDLWIKKGTPFKVFLADSVNRFAFWIGLFFFVVCSCLASLLSGIIIFGIKRTSKIKFMLLGLWNFLTLIGFYIAAYANKIDVKFAGMQEIEQKRISFEKEVIKILKIALISPILVFISFFVFGGSLRHIDFLLFIASIILYIFTVVLVAPFVAGYYKNKRIIKFVILFTVLFTLLTILFQYLLKLMFV